MFILGDDVRLIWYVHGCSPECMTVPFARRAYRGQERALNTLELELQVVVSHCVSTGTRTVILWKSSQGFLPLSHLCIPSGV